MEKAYKHGALTKGNINKRGYNKFLSMDGEVKVAINYDRIADDSKWDGLKGYLTNTDIPIQDVYTCLLYTSYIERTKGKRLAFFEKTEQMKDWLKEISPEVDFSDMYGQLPDGAQVGFISKKAGLIFAPNIIHAIKCKDNPYYGKCDAKTMLQDVYKRQAL